MLERQIEPNIDTGDDVSIATPLKTELPRDLKEEMPPYSESRNFSLAAGVSRTLDEFRAEIDGFLVYCVGDVDANAADQILVSNTVATGDHDDDILTPGKSVLILAQSNRVTVRNVSANIHYIVVKAFRGWTPQYL